MQQTAGVPITRPLQFAYQPHVGVDDAIIYLLQKAYSSLDRPNTSVRIMFFDFSSAFNTIQPRLLRAELENTRVGAPLVTWVDDYLTGRPQFVTLQNCYCTAIVGCVEGGREAEYRDLVDRFVKWCGENHLQLNVAKTKEMVVDFRRNKPLPSPVCIGGTDVEMVPAYRYLGVTLDNKLDWSTNTEAIYKKGLSRLYFLRRLSSAPSSLLRCPGVWASRQRTPTD
ncbi:hypothetical protein N1851_030848 [Merluccius polli]|uniref:Alkylated DNA repair protein AlkB homologue 8 N-terminal domain-containing protein n=1 Tax=Merluccius polli TaxID=89951 RepID=A0AA47M4Q7_MERPO|nr:hypothetical protein N1851_030848 [Merluccius polli]